MPDPIYQGIIHDRGGHVFNVQAYGATGDGDIRYNAAGGAYDGEYVAIMSAIQAANEAGGGIVYFPPTSQFYAIREAIQTLRDHPTLGDVNLDNVTLMGAGHGSRIRHIGSGYLLRLGGYEGEQGLRPWNEVFHDAQPAARGSQGVTFPTTTTANLAAWQPGDIVFVRTVQADPMDRATAHPKDLPLASEINEIQEVVTATRTVILKHPLSEDYPECRVARVTERTLPEDSLRPVTVLRRFAMQGLRLEVHEQSVSSTALSFGGMWECHFRDLWLSSGLTFSLNVTARCTFENIVATFWRGMGEIAYLSHHNLWRNIRASYLQTAASPMNGFACVEGTRDNTFENLVLNMGANVHRPFIMGGKRNKLLRSTVLAPATGLPAVAVMDRGRRYKPQGCVVEDCDVYVGSPPGTQAYFAIEVDSGGPHGGGCVVRGNRVYGELRLGMIGLTRADRLEPATGFDASGCERNVVEGNVHVHGAPVTVSGATTFERPVVSGVVEYNNRAPDGTGAMAIVDAAFVPGDNLVRDNETPLRQRRVFETALGGFASTAPHLVPAPVRRYTIPRYSVGTHHRWEIEARGRLAGGSAQQGVVLATSVPSVLISHAFPSGASGRWELRATVGGKPLNGSFQHADTAVGSKVVSVAVTFGGAVVATSHAVLAEDSNVEDFWVALGVLSGSGPAVLVDEWKVTPSGDEWTYLNWELVKARSGSYGPPLYYLPS